MEKEERNQSNPNEDQSLGDCGSIAVPPDILIDRGTLEPDTTPKTCFIAVGGVPDPETEKSGMKIGGESITVVKISPFVPHEDLNTCEIIYCGIVLTWIGFGTVFELDNGSERITSPYLSSGTVR